MDFFLDVHGDGWTHGKKFSSSSLHIQLWYGPLLKTVHGLDKTLTLSQAEREEVSQCILGTKGFFKDLLLGRYSLTIILQTNQHSPLC